MDQARVGVSDVVRVMVIVMVIVMITVMVIEMVIVVRIRVTTRLVVALCTGSALVGFRGLGMATWIGSGPGPGSGLVSDRSYVKTAHRTLRHQWCLRRKCATPASHQALPQHPIKPDGDPEAEPDHSFNP